MNRHQEISNAYKDLGKAHGFYDRMMTGTSFLGRVIDKVVWDMGPDDLSDYLERALAGIPDGFSGTLLEVPVGTGVLSLPVWKNLPDAEVTCLDYSEKMMETARKRAEELHISNVSFLQGDVGDLPFEDGSFDAVVSLNGFHAFPDKEAAFRETHRVLKKGGVFTGCFYIEKANPRTDKWIRGIYVKKGFFTPPFDTLDSLRKRLESLYSEVQVSHVQSIACFTCRK